MDDPPPNKPKSGKRWVTVLIVALFFVLLASIAMPSFGPKKAGCQLESETRMYQIALAVSAYHSDHQHFPERLSELVPDYASTDNFYFRCPYGAALFIPSGASKDPKLIDVFSPYELRTLGDSGAVVFERVPLWSDGKVGFCLIPPSLIPQSPFYSRPRNRISQEEFASRYSKQFQP